MVQPEAIMWHQMAETPTDLCDFFGTKRLGGIRHTARRALRVRITEK